MHLDGSKCSYIVNKEVSVMETPTFTLGTSYEIERFAATTLSDDFGTADSFCGSFAVRFSTHTITFEHVLDFTTICF